jgi:hypothetical protein
MRSDRHIDVGGIQRWIYGLLDERRHIIKSAFFFSIFPKEKNTLRYPKHYSCSGIPVILSTFLLLPRTQYHRVRCNYSLPKPLQVTNSNHSTTVAVKDRNKQRRKKNTEDKTIHSIQLPSEFRCFNVPPTAAHWDNRLQFITKNSHTLKLSSMLDDVLLLTPYFLDIYMLLRNSVKSHITMDLKKKKKR